MAISAASSTSTSSAGASGATTAAQGRCGLAETPWLSPALLSSCMGSRSAKDSSRCQAPPEDGLALCELAGLSGEGGGRLKRVPAS